MDTNLYILFGLVVFLLAVISVAMVAKQAGKEISIQSCGRDESRCYVQEEETRKQEWIDYYVSQGDIAKTELGWTPPAEVPQWQQHQMQQEQAQQASIPTMFSLDDV